MATLITSKNIIKALQILAGKKENLLEMFNKTSEHFKKNIAPDLVKWAMDNLKKDDRIKFFLKKARLIDKEYAKNNAKELTKEKTSGSYLNQTKPLEYLKDKLGHFISIAELNDYKNVLGR